MAGRFFVKFDASRPACGGLDDIQRPSMQRVIVVVMPDLGEGFSNGVLSLAGCREPLAMAEAVWLQGHRITFECNRSIQIQKGSLETLLNPGLPKHDSTRFFQ